MIRTLLVLSSSTLLLAFACAACDGSSPPPTGPNNAPTGATATPPPPPTNPTGPIGGERVLTVDDDGKAVTIARGAPLTLKLAAQAGTGFSWDVVKVDTAVLAAQGDRTSEVPSNAPGGGRMDVFHFTGAAPGTTSLELALRRGFDKDRPPARAFHVQVTVQ
jgi:inhibitor of cysteine peptidase